MSQAGPIPHRRPPACCRFILAVLVVVSLLGETAPVGAEVAIIAIDHARVGDILPAARMLLSPDGKLSVDRRTHSLVVVDSPAAIAGIESLVKKLDIPVPQITVRVIEYRDFIYITGEVKKPGAYSYEENMTVIKAVTLAGGLTDLAAGGRIRIQRKTPGNPHPDRDGNKSKKNPKPKEIKVKMDDLVYPNDIIIVPERFF